MGDPVTPSQLRADIYRLIDRVLETGEPLEIERRGRRLRLVPEQPGSRLGRLAPLPDLVIGDPDDLVTSDWSQAWDGERALEP
jgi:antitoxin (DNA-binding transcriptional repressor) of toxin-antitoxin stability system